MTLRTIWCASHVWVFFHIGKFEKVWIINNLHRYDLITLNRKKQCQKDV